MSKSENELIDAVCGLLDFTNQDVLTENANKQSQLVSTQRDLMAGEVSKYISKTKILPRHLVEAHDRGEIKIHDLDYYLNSTYNCELINLDDMLQNGTVITKKMLEKQKCYDHRNADSRSGGFFHLWWPNYISISHSTFCQNK